MVCAAARPRARRGRDMHLLPILRQLVEYLPRIAVVAERLVFALAVVRKLELVADLVAKVLAQIAPHVEAEESADVVCEDLLEERFSLRKSGCVIARR